MAQDETPVLPGDIDVLEQAADVAARHSRRGTREPKATREPKTTRTRAAKAAPRVAEQLDENTAVAVAAPVTEESVVTPVESSEAAETVQVGIGTGDNYSAETADGDNRNAEVDRSNNNESAPAETISAKAENEARETSELPTAPAPLITPPSFASLPSPLDAAPREERALESRGVRFRGREGRVEVRGRHEPRLFRRDDRDPHMPRDPRDPRDMPRDPRDSRDPREGNGGAPGRLSPPMRGDGGRDIGRDAGRDTGRDIGRDAGREINRDEPRDNRDNREVRGRFERDLPRGRQELDLSTLEDKNLTELREIAKNLNIAGATTMKKTDLVFRILEAQAETAGHLFKKGILDILPDGKGFLRTEGYLAGNEDVYVSQSQIKRFNLKTGDMVTGMVRPPKEMERHFGLLRVEAVNGEAPDFTRIRKEFEKFTPVFPNKKFKLETTQENITARVIDLVTPIGKGQRGLIVAPPKAGKTTLIKSIANSIALNHPEVILIVLLIDERPEEVTDIARSVKGEVVASTFDELPENHMRVTEMVFEKAKRLAEQKKDVVVLMDSLTRLARASNLVVNPSGRTMTGGLDPAAMYRPKKMFGAARNLEDAGSLTILATVLVDTGSRMDEYIFEELKGTGNMDLVLDRSLFDQRIFPSIDINKSGTRRDDLLLSKEDLAATTHLRRTLSALDNDKAILLLIDRLKNTKTNEEFMQIVQRSSRAQQA